MQVPRLNFNKMKRGDYFLELGELKCKVIKIPEGFIYQTLNHQSMTFVPKEVKNDISN